MAAPTHITLGDLSGDWILNRNLSDSVEPMLALQGISKPVRKILNTANMTLHISQYTGEDNNTHIDVQNSVIGGINASAEYRTLDWTERSQKNGIFGKVRGKTRWIDVNQIQDWYLRDGWEASGWLIETEIRSEKYGWKAHVVWGFAEIGGERHYVRKAIVSKGSEVENLTLVYDRV